MVDRCAAWLLAALLNLGHRHVKDADRRRGCGPIQPDEGIRVLFIRHDGARRLGLAPTLHHARQAMPPLRYYCGAGAGVWSLRAGRACQPQIGGSAAGC
eukprot:scaffold10356_cov118-Isochrysis_galbana.AAC.12